MFPFDDVIMIIHTVTSKCLSVIETYTIFHWKQSYAYISMSCCHTNDFWVNGTWSIRNALKWCHIGSNLKSPATCLFFQQFVPGEAVKGKQRKHQRSALLALCWGNPPITGGFPLKRDTSPWYDVITGNSNLRAWVGSWLIRDVSKTYRELHVVTKGTLGIMRSA